MPDVEDLLLGHGIDPAALDHVGSGQDHDVYATSDGRIVRVAKRIDAAGVRREARLLTAVSALLTERGVRLAVPEPLLVEPDAGLLVLRVVPGRPLLPPASLRVSTRRTLSTGSLHVPTGRTLSTGSLRVSTGRTLPTASLRESTGRTLPPRACEDLGALLTGLHQADLGDLVDVDDYPTEHLLAEAAECARACAVVLAPAQRRAVERFLAAEPPAYSGEFVFSHNDLGAEHLMTDGPDGALVGIIDWSDAAMAPRTVDFARLFRDFGPATHDAVLQHYRGPYGPADADSMVFRARCALLEDLAYGITTSAPDYTQAALRSFAHTFGESV